MIHVIIPVYKAEASISQALDSVLAQPYKNIRIICVDDGSPDDSIIVLQDYSRKHENIHTIQKKNGGVSAARNTGSEYVLAHSNYGDYVAFLDSDDLRAKNVITQEAVSHWKFMDCVGYTCVRCMNDLSQVTSESKISSAILCGGENSVC